MRLNPNCGPTHAEAQRRWWRWNNCLLSNDPHYLDDLKHEFPTSWAIVLFRGYLDPHPMSSFLGGGG